MAPINWRQLLGLSTPGTTTPATQDLVNDVPADLVPLVKAVQGINLRKEHAAVVGYLDRSNSTNDIKGQWGGNLLWTDGTMDLVIRLIMALILGGFDDDGKAPLRFFHNHVVRLQRPPTSEIDRFNFRTVLRDNGHIAFGGTRLIPVFLDLVRQALLLDATSRLRGRSLISYTLKIEAMTDKDLMAFLQSPMHNGRPVLTPKLKLPYPVHGVIACDGETPDETLEEQAHVIQLLSQLGIDLMIIGIGSYDFQRLHELKKSSESDLLRKNPPLWPNVDFIDLKELTQGGTKDLPSDQRVVQLLTKNFISSYPVCRRLGLIA